MKSDNQLPLQDADSPRSTAAKADSTKTGEIKQIGNRSMTITDLFDDNFEFIDDVHGPIYLNRLERDVVDSPEFQRLFRLSQLGFVDLVYPTANHTRAVHSIGACFLAKGLVDRLNQNNNARVGKRIPGFQDVPQISKAEKVLISLGGLLHDISHGPFSHDIEKKTHRVFLSEDARNNPIKVKSHYGPYEKHDSFTINPSLYVALMDIQESLLARILKRYSPKFLRLLNVASRDHKHIRAFTERLAKVKWPKVADEILPTLLFHLLVYEKPEDTREIPLRIRTSFDSDSPKDFGIGPDPSAWAELHNAWYQPFRHDVIGDTLSADLIDYLMRDQSRLGMKGALDDKLLNFYILVPWSQQSDSNDATSLPLYRSAIDLNDHKRGTFRGERLNDIFRLLDLRHQIHEKAVYHRVVQSAIAMLSRACLILGERKKPTLKRLYGYEAESPALAGDDHFLEHLIDISLDEEAKQKGSRRNKADAHRTLVHKLAERRVYRPLMVIPGDRVSILLQLHNKDSRESLELVLRQLAAIIDSAFFSQFFLLISKLIELFLQHAIESEQAIYEEIQKLIDDNIRLAKASGTIPKRVIFWTTPYKQLYKDPAILVRVNERITATIDELKGLPEISESLRSRIEAGIGDAETKNEALWKFYVFISDSLFYTGVLAKILPNHPCQTKIQNHEEHLHIAKGLIVRAINCAWDYWNSAKGSMDLNNPSTPAELRELLNLLQARRTLDGTKTAYDDMLNEISVAPMSSPTAKLASSYDDMLNEISGVQVTQYLHGDDDSTRCRDVRYKFDAEADFEVALQQVVNGGDREVLRAAYSSLGLAPDLLRMEELVEVLTKLHKNSSRLTQLAEKEAARNKPIDADVLRSFWNDLSQE